MWAPGGADRPDAGRPGRRREPEGGTRPERRDWERAYHDLEHRLMVAAEGDRLTGVTPVTEIPHLLHFSGRWKAGPGDRYLVPVATILLTQESLGRSHPIDALGDAVVAHANVLAPRSQETMHPIRRALEACRPELPGNPGDPTDGSGGAPLDVLDMGCGTGCCALLAVRAFAGRPLRVLATHLLPEAIATARINFARFAERHHLAPGTLNAPWVVAPARTPAETAINDPGQETIRELLREAPGYLKPGGRVIVGYSDNSGPRAVAALEAAIAAAGFEVARLHKDRIRTRRQAGNWETILAYDLRLPPRPAQENRPAPAKGTVPWEE